MIDFRYHIVSIVAIFLALAIGIVLGSTVLNAPLYASTERVTAQLRASNAENLAQLGVARARGDAADAFVAERLPQLLQGALPGARVVIVEAPGADAKLRDLVRQDLVAAGATVSGQVTLTDKYLEAQRTGAIDRLAPVKADVAGPTPTAAPGGRGAAALAGALLTGDPALAGKATPAGTTLLESFAGEDLIDVEGGPADRATLALLVAPAAPFEGKDAETRGAALVSLAGALDDAGQGTVVMGSVPVGTATGVIAAVRDSGDVSAKVSTVDNADLAYGRAAVVYALREQLAGDAGQYGLGSDADAPVPSPTATPVPTEGSGD
ncbi:hypothetical protein Sru01_42900 [Sphaerisporangium rufum]|uniref:Copper transporter n=1 Tax=Sphaerisporangium rufum TaxID=1381558 RepID=A0A919R4U1_9ACTN|nr:copper transporter [Sphaerisporangium rufum]GII79308.1 hypothetical protein Sru01_42900 [Sphaerisporangium rufum]